MPLECWSENNPRNHRDLNISGLLFISSSHIFWDTFVSMRKTFSSDVNFTTLQFHCNWRMSCLISYFSILIVISWFFLLTSLRSTYAVIQTTVELGLLGPKKSKIPQNISWCWGLMENIYISVIEKFLYQRHCLNWILKYSKIFTVSGPQIEFKWRQFNIMRETVPKYISASWGLPHFLKWPLEVSV